MTSRRPKRLTVSAIISSHLAASRTSTTNISHLPPCLRISSRTGSRCSALRLAIITGAPRLANSWAIPIPIPVPPPVTIVTLPSMLKMSFKFFTFPCFSPFRAAPLSPHHHYRTEGARANRFSPFRAAPLSPHQARGPTPKASGLNPERHALERMALLMAVAGVASRRGCGDNGAARKGEKHGKVERRLDRVSDLRCPAVAAAAALQPRGDLEVQPRSGVAITLPARDCVLPCDYPLAEQHLVDPEGFAHRAEGKGIAGIVVTHDPAGRVNVKTPRAGGTCESAFLVDINRVGQQRQHQALLAGQVMAARKVVVLARQDQVGPGWQVRRFGGNGAKPRAHVAFVPGRSRLRASRVQWRPWPPAPPVPKTKAVPFQVFNKEVPNLVPDPRRAGGHSSKNCAKGLK